MLEESELFGPVAPTKCSSLDDGPFCEPFHGGLSQSMTVAPKSETDVVFLSIGDQYKSAQFVVDGVLSHRIQMRNKQAFEWNRDQFVTFSSYVSRVVSDTLSGQSGAQLGSSVQQVSASARTGAQCFRIAFNRLPVQALSTYIPEDFSVGLPAELAVRWEGLWESEADENQRKDASIVSTSSLQAERIPWSTRLVLRTALGNLRFQNPVILRRFLIAVPVANVEEGAGGSPWGEGGLVCGRLEKRERWCVALDQVAASVVRTDVIGNYFFIDVGNSVHAIDEVAIIAIPPDSLRLSLVEVVATAPSHPLHSQVPAQRRVVLLKRSETSKGLSSQVEPTLMTVSRDAMLWDLNEVLKHHLLLRNISASRKGKTSTKNGKVSAAKSPALSDFQHMLQQLKSGALQPPPGVTLSRLKKEVVKLIDATKAIQDDDVLLHSKIETLIQQRLQEECLDGLLALQAVWRRSLRNTTLDERTPDKVNEVPAPAPMPMPKPKPKPGRKPKPSPSTAGSESARKRKKRYSRLVEFFPLRKSRRKEVARSNDEDDEEWTDAFARSLQKTSANLERRSEEIREKKKKLLSKGQGNMAINMNLEKGTIEFKVLEGLSEALQDMTKSAKALGMDISSGAHDGSDEASDSGEASDTMKLEGTPEEMVQKMARMVSSMAATQLGTAQEDGSESSADKVHEMSQALHENIQAAFGSHFAKQQGEDDDDSTKKPEPKIQMHVIKMDNDGSTGGLAEMLQSMMAEQGHDGQVEVGDEAMNAQDLFERAGLNTESMEEAFKAMLGQALQNGGRSSSADDSNEESSESIEIL